MPRATKEPAEKFGVALVAWVVGCAALAYEAKSFRSVVATRALALALAVLGTAALLEGARVSETQLAERATGYYWGEPRLKPYVERMLAEAERAGDDRLEQVARRFLR